MEFKKKWIRTLSVFLLPVISYGILGPLEIFCGNQKDFSFGLGDFFSTFLGMSFLILLFGSMVIAVFSEKINRFCCAIVLGIGVASWAQNMFMNIKLSENDGSPMKWDELGDYCVFNITVWFIILFLVFIVCIFMKKHWDIFSMGAAAFLSTIQLVAVISLLASTLIRKEPADDLELSGARQFQVAQGKNIIVFVLDTFGNTQLENAMVQYPDLLEGLNDFTFYNNMDCHYYCTFPSMTHLFTGEEFDFYAESSYDWLEMAWESERTRNFFNTLKEEEFTCNLFAKDINYVYGDINNLKEKFDNIQSIQKVIDHKKLTGLMSQLSIYRYVPYILKPYFEILTQEFEDVISFKEDAVCVDDNGEFYQKMLNDKLSLAPDMKNAMIVQQLFGTHQPYTLDINAETVKESDINSVVKGLMVIVNEYLKQIKEIGVYNDATIIITADHGSWYGGDVQPIFFMKRADEVHEIMQINTAPVSLDDFQATIMSVLGHDYTEYGTSIFDWKEGSERERSVYMRMTDEAYPAVNGSSWNVYYKYSYLTDKNELNTKVSNGTEEIFPATPW